VTALAAESAAASSAAAATTLPVLASRCVGPGGSAVSSLAHTALNTDWPILAPITPAITAKGLYSSFIPEGGYLY